MSKNYYDYDDKVLDERFDAAARQLFRGGKIPKINAMERKILEFCHNRDMKEFLREEFERHPIRLDENGELIGGNPFDKERRERGDTSTYEAYDPLYDSIKSENLES